MNGLNIMHVVCLLHLGCVIWSPWRLCVFTSALSSGVPLSYSLSVLCEDPVAMLDQLRESLEHCLTNLNAQ